MCNNMNHLNPNILHVTNIYVTDAKAKAEIKDVKKNGGKYVIYLTAENSVDCKTYEWERVR